MVYDSYNELVDGVYKPTYQDLHGGFMEMLPFGTFMGFFMGRSSRDVFFSMGISCFLPWDSNFP